MLNKLMKCGHTALSKDPHGKPACPMCVGITDDARTAETTIPDLTNRRAACSCGHEVGSRLNLPFFRHQPDREKDSFYCGCRGWN